MDIKDMTDSQKREKIKEITKKIEKVKAERNYAKAMQLALKLVLNGTYGAFCHPAFTVSNADIANAITASSREVINWMLDLIEEFFYDKWGRDSSVDLSNLGTMYISKFEDKIYIHRNDGKLLDAWGREDNDKVSGLEQIMESYHLNQNDFVDSDKETFGEYEIIKKVFIHDFSNLQPIQNTFEIDPRPDLTDDSSIHLYRGIRHTPMVIYGDTDSLYVTYTPIMESVGFEGNELKFILHMNAVFTQPMFNQFLTDYADKYGVESIHDFELETVNKSALHIQKKHYINNVVWEDGVFFEDLSHFYPKGVEIVKSSTPSFVRENIWDFIKYLFQNPGNVSIKEILKIMKNLKKEFKMADIEDISMTTSLNNYEIKIVDDQNKIEAVKGAHFSVKAALLHNYLLNNNTEFKTRYDLLNGGRIKWYFTKNDYSIQQEDQMKPADRFAYLRSFHPTEMVAKEDIECDYDLQFEKTFLSIANRFIEPIGLPQINKRLSVLNSLFSPNKKKKKIVKVEEIYEDDNIEIISSDDLDYSDDGVVIPEEIVEIEQPSVDLKPKKAEVKEKDDFDFGDEDEEDFFGEGDMEDFGDFDLTTGKIIKEETPEESTDDFWG